MALSPSSVLALSGGGGNFDLLKLVGGVLSGAGNALQGNTAPQSMPYPPGYPLYPPQRNFDFSQLWWLPLVLIVGLFVFMFKK